MSSFEVPVLSRLAARPGPSNNGRISLGAVPANRELLLTWFRTGRELLTAIEQHDFSKREAVANAGDQQIRDHVFLQALLQLAQYPSQWRKRMDAVLGSSKSGNGVQVAAQVGNLARFLNPHWESDVLIMELPKMARELGANGEIPRLSTYAVKAWLDKRRAYLEVASQLSAPESLQAVQPAAKALAAERISPQVISRVEQAYRLQQRLFDQQPDPAVKTECTPPVLRDLLVLRGLQLPVSLERGFYSKIAVVSKVPATKVAETIKSFGELLGEANPLVVVATLRALIKDRPQLGMPAELKIRAEPLIAAAAGEKRSLARRTAAEKRFIVANGLAEDGSVKDRSGSYDGLRLFLRQVSETALLTPAEERTLAARIQKGDPEARDHMIRANLRLVVKIARDYEYALPLLDLVQEGAIGLGKAVDKFDPTRAKLSTYASWWIKQAMKRAIANDGSTVRMPVHFHDKWRKLQRVRDEFKAETGVEPTDDELADGMGLELKDIQRIKLHAVTAVHALDAPVGNDEESSRLMDIIPDEGAPDSAENASRNNLHGVVQAMMLNGEAGLDDREKAILRYRFGLDDGGAGETLEDVGERFGVTRERVRQVQNIALAKLRRAVRKKEAAGPRLT